MLKIEYDGYEFENPVHTAKMERAAELISLSIKAQSAQYLPFPKSLIELACCAAAATQIACSPLFPIPAHKIGEQIVIPNVDNDSVVVAPDLVIGGPKEGL